jgi:hypothetical protein
VAPAERLAERMFFAQPRIAVKLRVFVNRWASAALIA